jgi:hypothetical protein
MPLAKIEVTSIGHGASLAQSCRGRDRERSLDQAAHGLRLAAERRFNEWLLCLRDAVLCGDHPEVLDFALDRSLGIGATSGADTVSGLLSGLAASLPAEALACSTKGHE